jgi:hypothetical protein
VYLLETIDIFIVSSLILTTSGLYLLNRNRVS